MGKPLTQELIAAKTKTEQIHLIKNLNLWGNDLDDLSIIRQMPSLIVLSLSVNKINSLRDF
jgi:Leucine-rich repeat (LRR) protein